MNTVADVFDLWGSAVQLAADIGVSDSHARAMKRRNSIPPAYWAALVSAAERRGFQDITFELLAELSAKKRAASEEAAP